MRIFIATSLVLIALAGCGAESDEVGASDPESARAERVCQQRKPQEVGDSPLLAWSVMSAREAAEANKSAGQEQHPWSEVTPDNFVATCTYDTTSIAPSTESFQTTCPDGDRYEVTDRPSYQYFFDEGGRSSKVTRRGGKDPCRFAPEIDSRSSPLSGRP